MNKLINVFIAKFDLKLPALFWTPFVYNYEQRYDLGRKNNTLQSVSLTYEELTMLFFNSI